jgi:hypothetical protein
MQYGVQLQHYHIVLSGLTATLQGVLKVRRGVDGMLGCVCCVSVLWLPRPAGSLTLRASQWSLQQFKPYSHTWPSYSHTAITSRI